MKQKLLLLGLAVVVIAGVAMIGSGPGQSSPAAAIVPFTTLAEGSLSTVTSRKNYLITTQEELTELWSFLKQPPPVPPIDFTTKVVAAVFAGEFPTAGYDIAVAQVEDANSRIVKIQLTKPDQSCVLAESIIAPYQIVALPKTSLSFTHDDIWTTKKCP